MWDEEDGFFYDVLRLPDGKRQRLKVRSMVGLLPLAAVAIFEEDIARAAAELPRAPGSSSTATRSSRAIIHMPTSPGCAAGACSRSSTRRSCGAILARMLDENEFLGPHGIRALSRYHLEHPFVFSRRRAGISRGLSAGRFGHRDVRRQFKLARPGLDAGELADHPALLSSPLLRRRFKVECPTGSGSR